MLSDSYTCNGQTNIEEFLDDPAGEKNLMEENDMKSNLSRGGVAYDLKSSPYRYCMTYAGAHDKKIGVFDTITFVFSSKLYRNKFLNQYKSNRKKINGSLSNRFGFSVDFNLLADLKLYSSIEKRGFLLYKNGESVECLSSIKLDGEKMTRTL